MKTAHAVPGSSRRDFLTAGALGVGSLTLTGLLPLRAADTKPKARSVILVMLGGGPPHIDMYDLKPKAPVEVRGEFRPIRTNVPGFDICELMPMQAQIADKLAVVRTVQFKEPQQHQLHECFTGFPLASGRPAFGAVVSRFGPRVADRGVPGYVSMFDFRGTQPTIQSAQYLGAAHEPLYVNESTPRVLVPSPELRGDRLADRKQLLERFDRLGRDLDGNGQFAAAATFRERALDLIASAKLRDAFDLAKEPDKVRQRYGKSQRYVSLGNYEPWPSEKFLLARRLVEAGVPVVTLRAGTWDFHGALPGEKTIFPALRQLLPLVDRSIHALVTDLHERGLDKEVAVLVWGEFGRTPRVNRDGGRDHWPETSFALFAGGGLKTGQTIGETDSHAALPKNRPLGPQNVLATLYHLLGIDPEHMVKDFGGRPTPLLDDVKPITELVS